MFTEPELGLIVHLAVGELQQQIAKRNKWVHDHNPNVPQHPSYQQVLDRYTTSIAALQTLSLKASRLLRTGEEVTPATNP